MEKFLKPYDKEFMRLAMLKHEETFKEQVHELHRLYRMQKILMRNIGSKTLNTQRNQESWNTKNSISFAQKSIMKLDLERTTDQDYAVESSGDHRAALEIIDESEIELTLGPPTYNRRNRKKPEAPLTSDSGPSSLSSSSTGSSHINKTTTSLSLHQKMNTKRSGGRESGIVQVPDMTLGNYQSHENNIDVDEQLRQERLKQPPWLFQVLSLNMA